MSVFVDRQRHTFLQYRDNGRTRHFVTMQDGTIECVALSPADYMRFKPVLNSTPEQFAKTYLSSYLPISRSARVVLRGILGQSEDLPAAGERASFSGGSVGIQEIALANNWDPSRCRKFLRKLVDKPGGRWEWSPEEADKITGMLKECFANE